jgi:hypothetical protein
MNTIQKYFRLNPKDMAYVKFIVESYGGLAVLRTLDPLEGIMEWMIPPHHLEEAAELIDALREEVAILPANHPETPLIAFSKRNEPAAIGQGTEKRKRSCDTVP